MTVSTLFPVFCCVIVQVEGDITVVFHLFLGRLWCFDGGWDVAATVAVLPVAVAIGQGRRGRLGRDGRSGSRQEIRYNICVLFESDPNGPAFRLLFLELKHV